MMLPSTSVLLIMMAVVPPIFAASLVPATVDSQPINLFLSFNAHTTDGYAVWWLPADTVSTYHIYEAVETP
jgi:hypothetical protein